MSGRSAHVRKEKTKVKDGGPVSSDVHSEKDPSLGDFPMPAGHKFSQELHFRPELVTTKTQHSSGSEDKAYARVRKPVVPSLDVSGIEKSSFRSMMDKKSEGARKALGNAFRKKKNRPEAENRPVTSNAVRAHELDSAESTISPSFVTPPTAKSRTQQNETYDFGQRSPPPTSQLPPIPHQSQVKQWLGGKKPPIPWAKLRKDPELWDDHGDVLVYFIDPEDSTLGRARPRPSLRLSSHILQNLNSPAVNNMLSNSIIGNRLSIGEDYPDGQSSDFGIQSEDRIQPNLPLSVSDSDSYGGEVSYEIVFNRPGARNATKFDAMRQYIGIRNFFAYAVGGVSLVGVSLASALNELIEVMEKMLPEEKDPAQVVVRWLRETRIDDLRENPSVAAGLLAWYESEGVRDIEGYRTAFCHCVGMYPRCRASGEWRYVSKVSQMCIDMAYMGIEGKVDACQNRLVDFKFQNMWPSMSPPNPPSRQACERFRKFILDHYSGYFGSWPPTSAQIWLTRNITQKLQRDFGALYDYLVNRNVVWDGSEERAGRKWHLKLPGNAGFDADTLDLPMTDILVAFDNRNEYPHIPHPYPLTPESTQNEKGTADAKDTPKSSKKNNLSTDWATERKIKLAYSAATNIYLLGDRFVENDFVDAFIEYEKNDMIADVDPFIARRGRWVLIYGILQTLASISVDVPGCGFTEDVTYFLNTSLKGCPPWRGAVQRLDEADHSRSHCWTIRNTWKEESPIVLGPKAYPLATSGAPSLVMSTMPPLSSRSSAAMSVSSTDTDYTSSLRSPSLNFVSPKISRHNKREPKGVPTSYSGYAPGIEKLEEEVQLPKRESSNVQFGSEEGEGGSQYGSDFHREVSFQDARRDDLAHELRNEALATQREFSRQESMQEARSDNQAQTSHRQHPPQGYGTQESRRQQNNKKFRQRVSKPEPTEDFGRQETTADFPPRNDSQHFSRRVESGQKFKRLENNQSYRHEFAIQDFDSAYDDSYDGIRDFDDYRI